MTPLHQLFAILHIDPGLIPTDLKCVGSIYANATLIRATITIQTPSLPQSERARQRESESPPFPPSSLPAFTSHLPTLPDHHSPPESPAPDLRNRLQDLRKLWSQLPNDTERARFAGRLFFLED